MPTFPSFPLPPRRRGVALIIVLAFLVLLSALVVVFFTHVQMELQGARIYSQGITVRQLADTSVNVVMSQIIDGTRSFAEPGNANSNRLTWSSQPGLIRTYDDDGEAGRIFKLFSSGEMVEPPKSDYRPSDPDTLKKEIPDEWPTQRALYTDLNEPVLVADPLGQITATGTKDKFMARFPILDPNALADYTGRANGVEGFTIETAPGFRGTWRPTPNYNPTLGRSALFTANPAPMPVQWIYVLQNGTLTSPFAATDRGNAADWSNLPSTSPNKPSRTNPIVGRIAFWADDETCKLNINTASEGVFWDRPWAAASVPTSPYGEQQLRDRLPVSFECQRYPGHPATVCLSPVLASLNAVFHLPTDNNFNRTQYDQILQRYYDLTPRIGTGGSYGGTIETGRTSDTPAPMTLDQNRLYASVDELIFGPPDGADSTKTPSATASRAPLKDPATGKPILDRTALEHARFFLTAYNRAPEVNVFGRPRISLWMLQQEHEPNAGKPSDDTGNRPRLCPAKARNSRDDLLAYCSTAGKFPFYFQRFSIFLGTAVNGRKSADKPFGQLPKFGYTQPSSQDPALDWTIPRNPQLYAYLQSLTAEKIPGWGGRMTDKYPAAGRNQLLTEMVDLLRAGTNGYAQQNTAPTPDVRYEYAPARRMPDATMGETQIVPLVPQNGSAAAGTKGFGRFPTITEAMLIFYRNDVGAAPGDTAKSPSMRVAFVLEPYSPTAGSWTWSPLVRYVVKGLDKISISGPSIAGDVTKAFAPGNLENLVTSRCGYNSGGNHNTAFTGTFASFRFWNTGAVIVKPGDGSNDYTKRIPDAGKTGDPEQYYNFMGKDIALKPKPEPIKGQFDFTTSGEITVEIHTGYADHTGPDTLVQTVHLNFPPSPGAGWPLPRHAGADHDFNNRLGPGKFNLVATAVIDKVEVPLDTVRSIEIDPAGPTLGDLRLVSAVKVVPSNYFAGYAGGADGPGYADSDAPVVHSLRNGNGGAVFGSKINGSLFDGLAGRPAINYTNAVVARGLKGANMRTAKGAPVLVGDLDNGPFDFPDGAYINKPDDYYSSLGGGDRFIADTVTPNRQVPSPVVFGSLPVNVLASNPEPWRTLLFCRNPAAGRSHPGFTQPRDHLLLDFFTMPIVEPYAISEPFSTAGKVNLNFEIAPFSYLRRDTALRGVLKSTRLTAIPNGSGFKTMSNTMYRRPISADETLDGFLDRFKTKTPAGHYAGDTGAFRSASELCDMPLVPDGVKRAAIINDTWWRSYAPTGDNARESPYGAIYSRVTTKSNVFTVHLRVQVLRKRLATQASDDAVWREGKDEIVSEYRGSSLLERYIDPSDPNLPDFADFKNHPEATMDDYYKFRILSTKKFQP